MTAISAGCAAAILRNASIVATDAGRRRLGVLLLNVVLDLLDIDGVLLPLVLETLEHGGPVHLHLAHRAVELIAVVREELELKVPVRWVREIDRGQQSRSDRPPPPPPPPIRTPTLSNLSGPRQTLDTKYCCSNCLTYRKHTKYINTSVVQEYCFASARGQRPRLGASVYFRLSQYRRSRTQSMPPPLDRRPSRLVFA